MGVWAAPKAAPSSSSSTPPWDTLKDREVAPPEDRELARTLGVPLATARGLRFQAALAHASSESRSGTPPDDDEDVAISAYLNLTTHGYAWQDQGVSASDKLTRLFEFFDVDADGRLNFKETRALRERAFPTRPYDFKDYKRACELIGCPPLDADAVGHLLYEVHLCMAGASVPFACIHLCSGV